MQQGRNQLFCYPLHTPPVISEVARQPKPLLQLDNNDCGQLIRYYLVWPGRRAWASFQRTEDDFAPTALGKW
jgi:hypothetical protein